MADTYRYSTPLADLFNDEEPVAALEPTGMVSRPAPRQDEPTKEAYDPLGFLPDFGATVRSFFTKDEAEEVDAIPRAPDVRTSAIDDVLSEMDMLSFESAMEANTVRDKMGVTGSLGSGATVSSIRPQLSDARTSARPQLRPEPEAPEIDTTAIEAVVEEVVGGSTDTEEPAATEGNGLMSRRLDTKGETPLNFLNTDTFKLLEGVEGFKSEPYSLNSSDTINGKPHKSGLTVGAGIDFGQHTRESLENIGLPKTMIDKAEKAGWIGLNPDTIIDPKTGKPAASRKIGHSLMDQKFKDQKKKGTLPSFTKGELSLATPAMYKPYKDAARRQVDAAFGEGTYDSLNEGSQAVLSLEKYHRGEGYTLPDAMIKGALSGNPFKAADGISWSSRRKNMKDWLKKLGFEARQAPGTSLRPTPRPTQDEKE